MPLTTARKSTYERICTMTDGKSINYSLEVYNTNLKLTSNFVISNVNSILQLKKFKQNDFLYSKNTKYFKFKFLKNYIFNIKYSKIRQHGLNNTLQVLNVVFLSGNWTESKCVGAITCGTTPWTGKLPQNRTNDHSMIVLQYVG